MSFVSHRACQLIIALSLSPLTIWNSPTFAAVEIDYQYDDLNRVIKVSRADGPIVDYNYAENGNLTVQSVASSPDTDGDMVADFADNDDDADGMPDEWELQFGLDPLNPADAAQDADGDGITNLQEFLNGTSPLHSNNPVQIPVLPVWAAIFLMLILALIGTRRIQKQGV